VIRRFGGLILLAPVGAFLAWQVAQTSAVGALVRRNVDAAARIDADHPSVRFGRAMREFQLNRGNVSETGRAAALAALKQQPLAAEPFMIGALEALVKKDAVRGEALLVEGRRRNPRSRLIRLLLLDRYLQTGRTAEAAVEIGALTRLISRAAEVLVPELARMAEQPKQRQALMIALRGDQPLRNSVLRHLAEKGADPDMIVDLAGPAAAGARPEADGWQRVLIDKLVDRGDTARAYRFWQTLGGGRGEAGAKGLYDGNFQGLPGLPPFNWRLIASGDGVAERAAGQGLQVTYYGRQTAEMARQLLMLQPGRYRLRFRAEGDASGEGSKVAWRVACHPGSTNLMEFAIANVKSTPRMLQADFVVPQSGCPAQWLTLTGLPAEFPSEQNLVIRELQIVRGGS
jgi:hypothetical protein